MAAGKKGGGALAEGSVQSGSVSFISHMPAMAAGPFSGLRQIEVLPNDRKLHRGFLLSAM